MLRSESSSSSRRRRLPCPPLPPAADARLPFPGLLRRCSSSPAPATSRSPSSPLLAPAAYPYPAEWALPWPGSEAPPPPRSPPAEPPATAVSTAVAGRPARFYSRGGGRGRGKAARTLTSPDSPRLASARRRRELGSGGGGVPSRPWAMRVVGRPTKGVVRAMPDQSRRLTSPPSMAHDALEGVQSKSIFDSIPQKSPNPSQILTVSSSPLDLAALNPVRRYLELDRSTAMDSTIVTPFDLEASRRRVTDLLDEIGGSEGHISEVSLGTRIVKIPSPRPLFRAAPEGSYMARKYEEFKWPPKVYGDPIPEMPLLLDRMHRYHLQALSLMTKEAVSRHARGMILAGYTYGLLPDPVANILANAFWYDSTFPPSPEEEAQSVKMLSAKAIFRMAARSLDALIAFLRHFAPALSIREICRFLARVDGNLQDAVSLLHDRGFGLVEQQAGSFLAAVQASDLPSDAVREAHLSFVTRYDSARDILVKHSGSVLSDLRINSLYPPRVPYEPCHVGYHVRHAIPGTSTSSSLSPSAYRALRLKMHSFRMEEELSLDLVSLALQNLALQFGESYELHMVCGKNYIIMPRSRGDYYHINFLASPEGGSSPPKLFFAEVRGVFKDVNDVTLCYPLTEEKASAAACQQEYGVCEEDQQTSFSSSKSTSRCLGCDTKGIKLIHPADVRFNGAEDGSKDHKAFAASSMPDPTLEFGAPLNEDYVFFSLKQHPWTAAFLEDSYSYMSDDQVDLSFMWFEDYLP